jgi:hypothetical protein
MISAQALTEFKEICKTELGLELSDEVALAQGINLLTLFDHIYQPIKQEWSDQFQPPSETT